jgi:hypothetical protein
VVQEVAGTARIAPALVPTLAVSLAALDLE